MAPKKNRTKVKQEPQGSCPHRATPPSKPGTCPCPRLTSKSFPTPHHNVRRSKAVFMNGLSATRRQRPRKLRRVRVWCHLDKLQKSTELYTPFAPFVRLVKEVTESCPSQVKGWTPEALLCLQDAVDFYLNKTFNVDLQLAIHSIRASSNDSTALNETQSTPSNQEFVQGARGRRMHKRGRKRKQSHIGAAIKDSVQYKTLEELSKKKQDEEFSVDKCLHEVDAMDGLTDVEKAYAMTVFKSEIDREVFMKMKNKNVRFIWLKQQISAISGSNVGGGIV